jgi:hypothetical protein
MGDYTKAIDNFEKGELLRDGGKVQEIKQRYNDLRRAFQEGRERGYWEKLWQWTERDKSEFFYSSYDRRKFKYIRKH